MRAVKSIRRTGGLGRVCRRPRPGVSYETTGTVMHILKDFALPMLVGQDVVDAADFQRRIGRIRGIHLAKAGIEMALWDCSANGMANRSKRCSVV